MPAIITDQYRILNAETFVDSFVGIGTTGNNNYYTFLGHPNPKNTNVPKYGDADWDTKIPDPKDNFDQENLYYDSMLFLKKVSENDVRRVVKRVDWQSGTTYDMYRNNYEINNKTPQTKTSTLYESNYYVVNSEYKVYLCLDNGANIDFPLGQKSQYEPNFVDTARQQAGNGSDGYWWKYLFTISPSDIVKFATNKYIPLPKKWGDTTTATVKNAAVDGKVESVILKKIGSGYAVKESGTNDSSGTISNIPIVGDGSGGQVQVKLSNGSIESVEMVAGGSGYTYGVVRFEDKVAGGDNKQVSGGSGGEFEVIIPPKGGHGSDIYRELGGYKVMIYSKYDNNVADAPDYVIGNDFSRVGLIKNPLVYGGTQLLNSTTATNLGALKLTPAPGTARTDAVDFVKNSQITQTVGVGSTAVGYVASWNPDTGILRYYQPVGFSTLSQYSYKKLDFVGMAATVSGGTGGNLWPDITFDNVSSIKVGGKDVDLGQTFVDGKAPPDVKKYSGDIIYIDNRSSVTRSSSQKEEVKIVVEF